MINSYLKIINCSLEEYLNSDKNNNTLYFISDTQQFFIGNKEYGKQGVSGVFVGSGDMPEGYNIQINPDAENEIGVLRVKDSEGNFYNISAIKANSLYEIAQQNGLPLNVTEKEWIKSLIETASNLISIEFFGWNDIIEYKNKFSQLNLYFIRWNEINENFILCTFNESTNQLIGKALNSQYEYYKIDLDKQEIITINLVDSELSNLSMNPVSNSAITNALDGKSKRGKDFFNLITEEYNYLENLKNPQILLYQNENVQIDEDIKISATDLINKFIIADNLLSTESEHPIQNKVVAEALNEINLKFNNFSGENKISEEVISVINNDFKNLNELIDYEFQPRTIYQISIITETELGQLLNEDKTSLSEIYLLISYKDIGYNTHLFLISQHNGNIITVNTADNTINFFIDSELSDSSKRPVQNKVIKNAIDAIGHSCISIRNLDELYNYSYQEKVKYFIYCGDNDELVNQFLSSYLEAYKIDNNLIIKNMLQSDKYYSINLEARTINTVDFQTDKIVFVSDVFSNTDSLQEFNFQNQYLYAINFGGNLPIQGQCLAQLEENKEVKNLLITIFKTGEHWVFQFKDNDFIHIPYTVPVDTTFSTVSTNPLENRVVTQKLTDIETTIENFKDGIILTDQITKENYMLLVENGSLKLKSSWR